MTVCCCLLVDRTSQVKHLDDTCRAKIEHAADDLHQLIVSQLAGAVGVYHNGSRLCHTDGVGQLDLALVSQTCCNDIFCHITGCVSCGTVNLGAVLTGECAAAVSAVSTIGVDVYKRQLP